MAVGDAKSESPMEPEGDLPPRYCKGSWRGQLIALGTTAALVLGFALNLRFGRAGLLPSPAGLVAGFAAPGPAEAPPPADGADPVLVQPVAANVRQVGTALRTDFNRAARAIRPATLAVRANFAPGTVGQPAARIGSAVVVDPSGYAVTCQHVIAGASTIEVRRFRETQTWLPARAIASEGDLALLKASDDVPFVAATFADSASVQVGDWVLAAGHPFQLGLTVTAGIVSRRDTSLSMPGGRRYTGLFQIDAAINEGSSGGPLVNLQGEVVGLNTAIYAPTGVFSGAGFAIPANRVRDFVARALGTGALAAQTTSWGFGLQDMNADLALRLSFPGTQGVVVDNVVPQSAAGLALLEQGDVITAIAGQPVPDLATAKQVRQQHVADPVVSIEIWRRGVRRVVTLRLRAG